MAENLSVRPGAVVGGQASLNIPEPLMVGREGRISAPVDPCLRFTSPEDTATTARLTTSNEHGASTGGVVRLLGTGDVLNREYS